jgi:excisionase family DNA binding protein
MENRFVRCVASGIRSCCCRLKVLPPSQRDRLIYFFLRLLFSLAMMSTAHKSGVNRPVRVSPREKPIRWRQDVWGRLFDKYPSKEKKTMKSPTRSDIATGVLTVREVAEYLRVHQTTVYRMLKEQKLPAFRVGSDWRFNREMINRWMIQEQKL